MVHKKLTIFVGTMKNGKSVRSVDQVAVFDAPFDVVHHLLGGGDEIRQLQVPLHEHERGEHAVQHRAVVYLDQLVEERRDVHVQVQGDAPVRRRRSLITRHRGIVLETIRAATT